ncbi:hypothetical protein ENUP19_0121G0062 [Entamoeba nuttalli]
MNESFNDITIQSMKCFTCLLIVFSMIYLLYLDYTMITLYGQAFFWAIFCAIVLSYPFNLLVKLIEYIDKFIYPSNWYSYLFYFVIGITPLIQLVISSSPNLFTLIPLLVITIFLFVNRRTLASFMIITILLSLISLLSTVVIKQSIIEFHQLINTITKLVTNLSEDSVNLIISRVEESYSGQIILEYMDKLGLMNYLSLKTIKPAVLQGLKLLSSQVQPYFLINLASSVTDNIFAFFIFIYSLLYFLIYQNTILNGISQLIPFDVEVVQIIRNGVASTSLRLILMNSLLFIFKFTLTFVTFSLAHLPYKMVCSIICALLAILPAFSNMIVWLPAGLVLFFQGNTTGMIWFISVHAVTYFIIDGWFYSFIPDIIPYFVGLSVVFGVYVFGITGCVLGPLVFVMTMTLKDIFILQNQRLKQKIKQD